MTAAERREQRRERLLDAGLEVFGTEGYASSSVRTICAVAELNSRYFYESFKRREDLLRAVYERIIAEIATAVAEATAREHTVEGQAREGLLASWKIHMGDPRKARVVAVEVVGVSDTLEQLRRDTRHAFADLLVRNALSVAREDVRVELDPVLTARALMGGITDVLVDWINGDVDATAEELAEHFTRLFTAAAYASVVDLAGHPLLALPAEPPAGGVVAVPFRNGADRTGDGAGRGGGGAGRGENGAARKGTGAARGGRAGRAGGRAAR
jgi:AcrR family transcriptional regulator